MKTHQRSRTLHCLCLAAAAMAAWHAPANAQTVPLGTADSFGVLAGAGITNTGVTTITGNVGSFPTTSQTGFGTVILNGANHGGDAVTQQAKIDLVTAYNNAAGRPASVTYAPASDLGGLTLVSGVYKNPTSFGLTGTLTLNAAGNANAVWIFQAGSTLTTAAASSVILINGAQACMVFWQITSSATLGSGSTFVGSVLALTSITAGTGAKVDGRLLARNGAVTLRGNTIAAAICPPTAAEVQAALLQAAQTVNLNSVPGLTSIYTLGFAQFDTEVFSLQQRFADIRAGEDSDRVPRERSPSSGKSIWDGKSVSDGKSLADGKSVSAGTSMRLADDGRWGFFINGTGDFATSGGADSHSVGTTVGVDYRLSDHFIMGLSIGYARSESEFSNNSSVKSDGGKVALYGMYQQGHFYTEGFIGVGFNSYDINRGAFLGAARGSTSGVQFDSYLGTGYDIKLGHWTVTPMASLLYTQVGFDSFSERGSLLPLNIPAQHASSLRTRTGIRVARTTRWGNVRVTPSLSAQWQHEFLDDQLPLSASFSNNASSLFTVRGPKIGRDSALLTAALNVGWSRYSAYVAYQADLGRKNYESQTALIGFRMSW